MDETIKIIRSILNLSSKGGMLIDEINKEYREEVGLFIPYREYGFNTLEEFLKVSNQFSGKKTVAGILVSNKIPGESAHIAKMRREQNVSASERKRHRKLTMAKPMVRQHVKSNLATVRSRSRNNDMPNFSKSNSQFRSGCNANQNSLSVNETINNLSQQVNSTSTVQSKIECVKPVAVIVTKAPCMTNAQSSMEIVKLSNKLDLHERLVAKQPFMKPKICESRNITPVNQEYKKYGTLSAKVNFSERLAAKQLQTPNSTPSNQRNENLLQSMENVFDVHNPEKSNVMTQSAPQQLKLSYTPMTTPKKKPEHRVDQTAFFNGKTARGDLNARLEAKQLSKSLENISNEPSPPLMKPSLRARLLDLVQQQQQKKTNFESNVHQLSEKLDDMKLMEVDPPADTTDSNANGMMTFGKKSSLNSRLQQKQFDMDWEDVSWTRSVCKFGSGFRITVHF